MQEHHGAVRTEPAVAAWLAPCGSLIKAGDVAMLAGSKARASRTAVTGSAARHVPALDSRHQRAVSMRAVVALLAAAAYCGLPACGLVSHASEAADGAAQMAELSRESPAREPVAPPFAIQPLPDEADDPVRANFERERASPGARDKADWVVSSGDNGNLPFVIVDKSDARVFVFDARGRLRGAAPALLGLAVGDVSVPGIGDRKMSRILPHERTTPAGRFVASMGHNARGKEILWVDYRNAISMHPVVKGTPKERRAERLATPTPLDNRISYGCINVPAQFFHDVVHAVFAGKSGIVYVLSEDAPIPGSAIR